MNNWHFIFIIKIVMEDILNDKLSMIKIFLYTYYIFNVKFFWYSVFDYNKIVFFCSDTRFLFKVKYSLE